MTSTILDVTIVVVLIASALISFFRGFVREILTIAGLVGAAGLSYAFGGKLSPWFFTEFTSGAEDPDKVKVFFGMVPADLAAPVAGYGTVFLGVFIALTILSFFISDMIEEMGLGAADKTLGVFFGLARGFVLVMIIYLPFTFILKPDEFPPWVNESKVMPSVMTAANWTSERFDLKSLKLAEDEKDNGQKAKEDGEIGKTFDSMIDQVRNSEGVQDALGREKGYGEKARAEFDRLIDRVEESRESGGAADTGGNR